MTPIAALYVVATAASGEERRVTLGLEAPRPTVSGTWLCALTLANRSCLSRTSRDRTRRGDGPQPDRSRCCLQP